MMPPDIIYRTDIPVDVAKVYRTFHNIAQYDNKLPNVSKKFRVNLFIEILYNLNFLISNIERLCNFIINFYIIYSIIL